MEATWLTNLVKALEYEEMLIGNLLAIGKEKTELLAHNKPMELPAITSKESQLIEQMNQLEKVRMQLNAKAAEILGIGELTPTISTLCQKLEANDAQRLSGMRDRLKVAMGELQQRNHINAELLQQSIDYVNFNLQLLAKPTASIPSYGRGGRDLSDAAPTRSVMDLRS